MTPEKRLLVVDDDDAIRALVTTVLRRRRYLVDSARNGEEAMARLESCRYALVILDLMMPRMSGYDLIDRLAAMPPESRPLVLVLTAGIEPRTFDASLVIGTMHKPFDIELLLDTVNGSLMSVEEQRQYEGCRAGQEVARAAQKTN